MTIANNLILSWQSSLEHRIALYITSVVGKLKSAAYRVLYTDQDQSDSTVDDRIDILTGKLQRASKWTQRPGETQTVEEIEIELEKAKAEKAEKETLEQGWRE